MVTVDNEQKIDYAPTSPFGGGKPGRARRRTLKKGGGEAKAEEK